jgi:hypothetical protein
MACREALYPGRKVIMAHPRSIRTTERTEAQINDLEKWGYRSFTNMVEIALDRLWRQEYQAHKKEDTMYVAITHTDGDYVYVAHGEDREKVEAAATEKLDVKDLDGNRNIYDDTKLSNLVVVTKTEAKRRGFDLDQYIFDYWESYDQDPNAHENFTLVT